MTHTHNPNVDYLTGIDSGFHQRSRAFCAKYQLQPSFDINCLACCATYLQARGYQFTLGGFAHVSYGPNPTTSCFLDGPRGSRGVHGLVATGVDFNLGQPMTKTRPVDKSHSYQFYNANPGGLAIGSILTARVEAIAVTQIRNRNKLVACYLNLCDAALLESYLTQMHRRSLDGTIIVPEAQQIAQNRPAPPQDPLEDAVRALSLHERE
eukprot:TRINITY_DN13081_c0_g1_i1.p1 TRINITY_DN13081_c0_g1~~TRINITY_DN13081_c0_g1_i1.p1  ORF type:complete len:209 (+),score=10.52 TRINITY_DN13081_c0_g1_i1:40-666(+)